MKKYISHLITAALVAPVALMSPTTVFAETVGAEMSLAKGIIAIGAGIALGVAALGGALGQGKAVSAALDSIGRNPAASGKVLVPMIVGLALIESLVILAFVIAKSLVGFIGG